LLNSRPNADKNLIECDLSENAVDFLDDLAKRGKFIDLENVGKSYTIVSFTSSLNLSSNVLTTPIAMVSNSLYQQI